MEDKPESKPPFWSTLPGILTALGGVVVAVTGLISVLVTTGVMGPKANTNTQPQANVSVPLVSEPATSQPANADTDRYKSLTGKWEVTEQPSQDFDNVKKVTWHYDATVSGNELTLKGKIYSIDGDKNLSEDEESIGATIVSTLINFAGIGEYRLKKMDDSTVISPVTMRFEEGLTKFQGKIDIKGQPPFVLTGRKL